jgi:hypothetical protein
MNIKPKKPLFSKWIEDPCFAEELVKQTLAGKLAWKPKDSSSSKTPNFELTTVSCSIHATFNQDWVESDRGFKNTKSVFLYGFRLKGDASGPYPNQEIPSVNNAVPKLLKRKMRTYFETHVVGDANRVAKAKCDYYPPKKGK